MVSRNGIAFHWLAEVMAVVGSNKTVFSPLRVSHSPPPPRLCSILVMSPCFYWQLISHSPPFLLIPDWSPPKIPPPFAPKTINNEWFEEQNMCQWYLNPCHMKVVITNCICCRLEYPKCDQTPLIWTAEWEHN